MTGRDVNGDFDPGIYMGRPVHVYGHRGGFSYFAFADDLSWVTKVPAVWVSMP